jgi:hypothetical protein
MRFLSEALGLQEGVKEVHAQCDGNQQGQNIFHVRLPGPHSQAVASFDERPSRGEKQNRDRYEREIQHLSAYSKCIKTT